MKIDEYNKFVKILGFRDVKIGDINVFLKKIRTTMSETFIQLFDADFIAGVPHLFFAVVNALKAFEQGINISEKLEMEILLYASGQRQISKAIKMLGVRSDTSKVALLLVASNEREMVVAEKKAEATILGMRDDSVLNIERDGKFKKLMTTFEVTNLELETMVKNNGNEGDALTWLIVERNALLTIKH